MPTPTGSYSEGRAVLYPVRLGPLRFQCQVGDLPEQLGDKLESVGAAVVPGDRSPRPAQVSLPVRGSYAESDDRQVGIDLRRQVRALLENDRWKAGGLYYEPGWDPDAAAWILAGSGQLTDEQRGIAFGDWRLTLDDAYLAGRPATHRRGRRVTIADRLSPSVALDTRQTLFASDAPLATAAVPEVALPGDIAQLDGYGGRIPTTTPGPSVDGRVLWRTCAASDGEGFAWRPRLSVLPDAREREARVEDVGAVRAWWCPTLPSSTPAGDRDPDTVYGWRRVLGGLHDTQLRLAMDNGRTRIVWLGGTSAAGGLRIERWDDTADGYVPVLRVLNDEGQVDAYVVSCTPERAVLAWRVNTREMRVVLQRGWPGPRIESYAPPGSTARLAVFYDQTGRQVASDATDRLTGPNGATLATRSHNAVTWSNTTTVISGGAGEWNAPGALVMQLDTQNGAVAAVESLARWDVRPIPTLSTR